MFWANCFTSGRIQFSRRALHEKPETLAHFNQFLKFYFFFSWQYLPWKVSSTPNKRLRWAILNFTNRLPDKSSPSTQTTESAFKWSGKLTLLTSGSCFSTLIILLGSPIFSCFHTDAISSFICSNIFSPSWTTELFSSCAAFLLQQMHLPCQTSLPHQCLSQQCLESTQS